MKAIGYFRVTLDLEHGVPSTMVEQEQAFSRYCRERGYSPATAFADMDSGSRISDTEYQNMIRYIHKQQETAIVVVKSLQHLHPDIQEAIRCILELEGLGVQTAVIDGENEDPLAQALKVWYTQHEGESGGDKVREAMRRRAIHGMGMGKPPFGYRIGASQKLEAVPDEANTVNLIYRLYLEKHMGVRRIARYLNEQGITTRRGGLWSIVGIRDILRNRTYVGTYSRFGVKVPANHPAIIPEYVFKRVQERLSAKSRRPEYARRQPFLLTGLVYCGACGNKMIGVHRTQTWTRHRDGKQSKGEYRYYQCQTRANQSVCQYHTRRADELESVVLATLNKLNDPQARQHMVEQSASTAEKDTVEKVQLTKKVKAIDRKLRSYINKSSQDELSLEDMRSAGVELTRERQFLARRLGLLEAEARGDITAEQRREYTLEVLDNLQDRLDSLTLPMKRSLLQFVIDRIVVYDERVETLLKL